jgi:hypothetical protein
MDEMKVIPVELPVMHPKINVRDNVMTNEALAKRLIEHFAPSGFILEPCKGDGAFYNNLPEPKDWCEIRDGRDFLEYNNKVDWIITNPPYSTFNDFLLQALAIANEIVFLVPIDKIFVSKMRVKYITDWGGIKEILLVGTGTEVGFPFGFLCGAIHFSKGFQGCTKIHWIEGA